MTELSTDDMGLRLRNPLVASASPMSTSVQGVGAVVLYSLFAEQVRDQ